MPRWMTRRIVGTACLGLAVLGCSNSEPPQATTLPATSGVQLTEAEIDALAQEQKVCAVAGEPLGSMGTPVPVEVADSTGRRHTVLLCCEGCREELLAHPDEHLAKIGRISKETPSSGG